MIRHKTIFSNQSSTKFYLQTGRCQCNVTKSCSWSNIHPNPKPISNDHTNMTKNQKLLCMRLQILTTNYFHVFIFFLSKFPCIYKLYLRLFTNICVHVNILTRIYLHRSWYLFSEPSWLVTYNFFFRKKYLSNRGNWLILPLPYIKKS